MEPQMPEESLSADRIEAVEMLTEGRGLAFQLRDLFLDDQIPVSDDRLLLAEDLLEKIQCSFTDSISALDLASSEPDEIKSEDCWSGESSKSATLAKTRKAAASSSSKRSSRKMNQGQTWTEVTSSLVDDGHAWRKYGQKPILNATHSRNYYKCSHKDNLGCPAKKHVQQISDDPLTYKTVYTFSHTCHNFTLHPPAQPSQIAVQPDMNPSSSIMLNFQSNQQEYHANNYSNAILSNESNQEHIMTQTDQAADHRTSVLTSSNNMGSFCPGVDEFMNSSIECPHYISYGVDDAQEDPWFT